MVKLIEGMVKLIKGMEFYTDIHLKNAEIIFLIDKKILIILPRSEIITFKLVSSTEEKCTIEHMISQSLSPDHT